MQLSVPLSTRCSSIQHKGRMRKFMGLHHCNLLAQAPTNRSNIAALSRNSSGPLMPRSSSSSSGMLIYAPRDAMGHVSLVTVRCLPAEDDAILQDSAPDTDPGDASIAQAMKGDDPKGRGVEDAAMHDPVQAGLFDDTIGQELSAPRQDRQDANASSSADGGTPASRVTGSDTAAGEGESKQATAAVGASAAAAGGGVEAGAGGSNAPGDDPAHIKQVVEEETLHG